MDRYYIAYVRRIYAVFGTIPFCTHPAPQISEILSRIPHLPVPPKYVYLPLTLKPAGLLAVFSTNKLYKQFKRTPQKGKRKPTCCLHVSLFSVLLHDAHILADL